MEATRKKVMAQAGMIGSGFSYITFQHDSGFGWAAYNSALDNHVSGRVRNWEAFGCYRNIRNVEHHKIPPKRRAYLNKV